MASKKTAKKTSKTSAPKKEGPLDFCRAYLKKSSKASFAEIRDAAKKKGLVLYPISYGRAKALEGLVPTAAYGSKKKAAAKRGPGRPKGSKNKVKRGPGRPRKSAASGSLDDIVATIQRLEQERDDAVATLDKIRALLGT